MQVTEIRILVYGTPAPQGSKRHVGNGRMIESSAAVRPWREAVKAAALDARSPMLHCPVEITAAFYLKRPKSHYGTGRKWLSVKPSSPERPGGKPDLDKLLRSTLDGLTGVLFADDAQVVTLDGSKWYADAGQRTGAIIRIREVIA